jgi:hypothetical protein
MALGDATGERAFYFKSANPTASSMYRQGSGRFDVETAEQVCADAALGQFIGRRRDPRGARIRAVDQLANNGTAALGKETGVWCACQRKQVRLTPEPLAASLWSWPAEDDMLPFAVMAA